ncbi:putative ATP-dependent DNA helicase [Magnetofaba australis IT-1]|uniref:Putative ATP-dependent DNA helicase n=2 Tax=Magnetofaba TaxID=1472292 RepID=A0A1Y2K017_9PROT|nr:putative ATP-dependent DNA helicase [Magnetofaba australis IT-1]
MTPQNIALWAQRKGIGVVGTADFTHPVWRQTLREALIEAEPGLFQLRPDLAAAVRRDLLEQTGPALAEAPAPRFLLTTEIAVIYQRAGKTRRIHHLICLPSFAAAERLSVALAQVGNLHADGRPMLGLDSRDLLAMTLHSDADALLIPAHVWTPWYALLGARSGFDSVEACFGDLTPHILALETGLSADPAMMARVSSLDRYRLVSHSDAHSPSKLGREATRYECELDYHAMRRALATGAGYGGTIEFFPQEGKYFHDGHRACDVHLNPEVDTPADGLCPVCGKALTTGVLNRVLALADRPANQSDHAPAPFVSLTPLAQIVAELAGVKSPNSKRVTRAVERLLGRLGPEIPLLTQVPLAQIAEVGSELLAEAIRRLRAGQVIRQCGYDGVFGRIRLFAPDEAVSTRRWLDMLYRC